MVDAWIIKEIEREKRRESDRPFLELPLDDEPIPAKEEREEEKRGVITIPMWGDDDEED